MTAWETTLFLQSYAKLYIYSHVHKYLDAKYWRKRHCRSDTQVSPRRLSNAVSQTNDSPRDKITDEKTGNERMVHSLFLNTYLSIVNCTSIATIITSGGATSRWMPIHKKALKSTM